MRNLLGRRQMDGTPRHRTVMSDVPDTGSRRGPDDITGLEDAIADADTEFSRALSTHKLLQTDLSTMVTDFKDVSPSIATHYLQRNAHRGVS